MYDTFSIVYKKEVLIVVWIFILQYGEITASTYPFPSVKQCQHYFILQINTNLLYVCIRKYLKIKPAGINLFSDQVNS